MIKAKKILFWQQINMCECFIFEGLFIVLSSVTKHASFIIAPQHDFNIHHRQMCFKTGSNYLSLSKSYSATTLPAPLH